MEDLREPHMPPPADDYRQAETPPEAAQEGAGDAEGASAVSEAPAAEDAQRRLRERDKKRRWRAAMTDEQRQAARAEDAKRKRRSRAAMADKERPVGRAKRKRPSRAGMTENERPVGRAKRKRRSRAEMTEDERREARAGDAERRQRRLAAMTEEERKEARRKEAEYRRTKRGKIPFYGVDCEGAGQNSNGQQNLVLMGCAGDGFSSALHKRIGDCDHISTEEAFEWILSLPAKSKAILVSYYFNYDATQILRDIGTKVAKDLFRSDNYGPGGTRYWSNYNKKYAIKYTPKKQFAVVRRGEDGKRLPETARVIHDVFGLFQNKFVETAEAWQLADPAKLGAMKKMKKLRREFTSVTPEMVGYNLDECRMLAQLMTRYREHSHSAGIYPRSWAGAGPSARYLIEQAPYPKRPLTAADRKKREADGRKDKALRRPERPPEFEKAATYACFAGRQEATRVGHLCRDVFRHDIHSCYPAKLALLPCPMHMRVIRQRSKTPPAEALYLGWCHFQHPADTIWGGLPVRGDGRPVPGGNNPLGVYWPLEACGYWWSPEIRAAQQYLGMTAEFEEIWVVECSCQCDWFGFIRDLYAERQRLGTQTEGLPIKFAMNAITGKFLQKAGERPWYDLAFGGLVNSLTRAQVTEAIGAVGQREAIMTMTDCVYATKPLPPSMTGDGLGQFGAAERFSDLWIVKPGLSWATEKLVGARTRGIPSSVIADTHGTFERKWHNWLRRGMPGDGPAVAVEFEAFVGLRAAAGSYRDLKRAGRWEMVRPEYGFGWRTKHDPARIERHGDEVWLRPLEGSMFIESRPYDATALDDEREGSLMDAMPDYVPVVE